MRFGILAEAAVIACPDADRVADACIHAAADFCDGLGAHKNTVRGWIKNGLPVFAESRPVLILGHELRAFLERKQKAAKRPCGPGQFYCFKCRDNRQPALGMVEYRPRNALTGNLRALCEGCGAWMHRAARLAAIPTIMPNIDVQISEAEARIRERANPSLNCDNLKD